VYKFRVVIGTSPTEPLKSPTDILPSARVLEDRNNIDITTEIQTIHHDRVCYNLLNYLRSVMQPNYRASGLPDAELIMISCPRLVQYELMVIEFAIKLMKHLMQEMAEPKLQKEMSYREKTIAMFNRQ
jgi:hypothetical protein